MSIVASIALVTSELEHISITLLRLALVSLSYQLVPLVVALYYFGSGGLNLGHDSSGTDGSCSHPPSIFLKVLAPFQAVSGGLFILDGFLKKNIFSVYPEDCSGAFPLELLVMLKTCCADLLFHYS